jgi:hypothetical protein
MFIRYATCPGRRIDAQEEPRFYYDEKGMTSMQAQRAKSEQVEALTPDGLQSNDVGTQH